MTPPSRSTPHRERFVPRHKAVALCYRVLLRQILGPGRLVALGLLGVAMMLTGLGIRLSFDSFVSDEERVTAAARFVDGFGLIVVLPLVTLLFAISVLANARDDGTLMYLWLRPMDRSSIAIAAAAAATTVGLPLVVIPTVATAFIVGGDTTAAGELVVGAVWASVYGTLAYSSVFVLVGVLLKRAVLWGLAYMLVWEGIAATIARLPARLSLHGYTRSLLENPTNAELGVASVSTATAVIVLLAATIGAIAATTSRLNQMTIT